MIVFELIGNVLLFMLVSQLVMGGLAAVIVLHWLMMRKLESLAALAEKRNQS